MHGPFAYLHFRDLRHVFRSLGHVLRPAGVILISDLDLKINICKFNYNFNRPSHYPQPMRCVNRSHISGREDGKGFCPFQLSTCSTMNETPPRSASPTYDNKSQALDLEDTTLGIVAGLGICASSESLYFHLHGPDEHCPRHPRPCCYECTRLASACGNLRLQGKRVLIATHVPDASFSFL